MMVMAVGLPVAIFLAAFAMPLVSAQPPQYRMLSTIETSDTEDLNCIYFDRDGLLWMGTGQGVKSYDGYRTRTYRTDLQSPGILPDNTVLCLTEDHEDGLWAGTRDGLVRMDRRTGAISTYRLPSAGQRIIYTLYTDRLGTVWIGTDGGLTRYVKERDAFFTYHADSIVVRDLSGRSVPIGGYSVKSIVEDKRGNLYIGTWSSGVMRFNPDDGHFTVYPELNTMNSAYALFFDSRDRLWIGTWGFGLARIDRPLDAEDPGVVRYRPGRRGFDTHYHFIEDPLTATIWACSRGGVSVISPDGGSVWNYAALAGQSVSFCKDILTDGHGNIYLATIREGIRHVSTRQEMFRFHEMDTDEVFAKSRVNAVFTADGRRFWSGLSPYGVALYDRESGTTLMSGAIAQLEGLAEKSFRTEFTSIISYSDNEIWAGSSSTGIVMIPATGPGRIADAGNSRFVFDNVVNALFKDDLGRVWIGARSCLSVANPDGSGKRLTLTENGEDFSDCDVRGITSDHEGNIWVSTKNEGIIRISPALVCHRYGAGGGNLQVDDVTACFEDSRHRLWAISASGGLFRYDRGRDLFVPVNREYGIGASSTFAINEDRFRRLWLSTEQGMYCLAWNDGEDALPAIYFYSRDDGLEHAVCQPNSTFRHGEELYFGTERGFYSFAPGENLMTDNLQYRLLVTDLYVDGRPFDRLDAELRQKCSAEMPQMTRHITLPSSVGRIDVEFALLTYSGQEKNQYAYRLEGYDDDWSFRDASSRRATYENLPAGTYTLHLKASDSRRLWTELPYAIQLHVLPPWYLSWWMWLVYVLMSSAAVYGAARLYMNYHNAAVRLRLKEAEEGDPALSGLDAGEEQLSADELFLERAIRCVSDHLEEYDREQFARDMCVSSSTLYNKLRALTGQGISAFILSVRMKEACRIARQNPDIRVNELGMAVGINTPKYFTRCFKEEIGMLPSEYIEKVKRREV